MRGKRWATLLGAVIIGSSAEAQAYPDFGDGYWGRVLVQGPPTHAAAGLKFDPSDRLWVANIFDHTIRRVHRVTGAILEEITYDEGVRTPDDLTFGPDGTMYWANFLSGDVGKRTPDGTVSYIANIGEGVDGITAFPDGRLFAGRFLVGDELFEIDPEGVEPPRLVRAGLIGLEALEAGPDGAIYASLILDGQIIRIDKDTGATTVVLSGLDGPIAQRFAPNGDLYVIEYISGKILKRPAGGSTVQLFATTDTGVDGIDFDSHGRLYTSNWISGRVERVLPGGLRIPVIRGGSVAPGGLAATTFGGCWRIWSAEISNARSFDPLFGFERDVHPTVFGAASDGLALPFTVAAHGSELLTSSWFSNAVQRIDPDDGSVIAAYEDFSVPMNAISFGGDIVVAEAGTGAVVRRNLATGATDVLAGGFALPVGLATDGASLWVSDWAEGTIHQIVDDGVLLPAPVVWATGLVQPEGLAAAGDGTLYVNEAGLARVVAVDEGGNISVVASNLAPDVPPEEHFLPTWIFAGVAVDDFGLVYASVPGAAQILQIGGH
jgi:sugar lactone lactonase YvrE